MPMSGRGRWTVDNDGSGVLAVAVVVVVVAVGVVSGVVWLLADTVFLPVAAAVLGVACVTGTALAVRNVVRDRGLLWRAESESLLLKAFRWRPVRRVRAVPVAALPAREQRAIEAPKPPLTGVVLERGEVVAAGLAEAGD